MTKRYRKKDQFRKREGEQYENPVASREHICQYLTDIAEPCSEEQLLAALAAKSAAEKKGLSHRLKAMCRDGQLMLMRNKKYALVKQMGMATGRVQANRDGYGFLLAEDGREDVFLSTRQMRGLFNEDRVVVRVVQRDKKHRAEGIVVEILERATNKVVGRYFEDNSSGFVEPHNKNISQDILIPQEFSATAKSGDYVVVEITAQPTIRRQPVGKINLVLGNQLTPGLEVELAIQAHQIPYKWSEKVLTEAESFAAEPSAKDIASRVDLRKLPFVTIDGADARDFDDAVYCRAAAKGGWRLQVAIADVSFYVREGSALDNAAMERGNSVYFPSAVMPMLPESLSNGLCSLRPNVDRLVMVCDMDLDPSGKVINYNFYEAVIHSHARLTYSEVAAMLDKPEAASSPLLPEMQEFQRLYNKLIKARNQRGSIEFETTETRVLFTPQGKIAEIIPVVRNVAHRMIEEAMLLANVCAATMLSESDFAGIYRIHEPPQVERLEELRKFLNGFSLRLEGGSQPHAKDYGNLIQRIAGRKDSHLLHTVLLRSMQRAVYSPEDEGHFALSYPSYTHFTSPIRRYPDLMVHRIIKSIIAMKDNQDPKKSTAAYTYTTEEIHSISDHLSMTERRADLATRDALDWLKCHYMQDKVGDSSTGVICDVTPFGIFVELDDIYVSGLIHISQLPGDYYQHDPIRHELRGRKSNRTFRLGDSVAILIARVDLDKRQIDFDLQD